MKLNTALDQRNGVLLVNPKWDIDDPAIPTTVVSAAGSPVKISVRRAHRYLSEVRQYCIAHLAPISALLAECNHQVLTPDSDMFGEIAFTDGITVFYGGKFFLLNERQQAFVIIHEVLHVALNHPSRMMAMSRSSRNFCGDAFNPKVYNIAADAVINRSVATQTWTSQLAGTITFQKLLTAEELGNWPEKSWSVDELYCYLMQLSSQEKKKRGLPSGGKGGKDGTQGDDANGLGQDLATALEKGIIQKELSQAQQSNNTARIRRAAAGDRPSGLFRDISSDLEDSDTPWQTYLRRLVVTAALPKTELDTSRPCRSTLAMHAWKKKSMTIDGINEERKKKIKFPIHPGIRAKRGVKNIVVCVDTSGSITDDILRVFLSEVEAIRNQVSAFVTIITCDAAVHQVIEIPPGKPITNVMAETGGLKGGGGTRFEPAVEVAEKIKDCACIVYLTDMMGSFPQECSKKLIWASICATHEAPPVGDVIYIKEVF